MITEDPSLKVVCGLLPSSSTAGSFDLVVRWTMGASDPNVDLPAKDDTFLVDLVATREGGDRSFHNSGGQSSTRRAGSTTVVKPKLYMMVDAPRAAKPLPGLDQEGIWWVAYTPTGPVDCSRPGLSGLLFQPGDSNIPAIGVCQLLSEANRARVLWRLYFQLGRAFEQHIGDVGPVRSLGASVQEIAEACATAGAAFLMQSTARLLHLPRTFESEMDGLVLDV
jgi:hypothetical protein